MPLLEQRYCDLLQVKPKPNAGQLVDYGIRQLTYMSGLTDLQANQVDQIDRLYNAFVKLVINNSCVKLYNKFPPKWVYCRDIGGVFLDSKSVALSVENVVFPELCELPRVYQDDPLTKKFFIR